MCTDATRFRGCGEKRRAQDSNLYGLAPSGLQERVSLTLTHTNSHPLGRFADFTPTDSRSLVSTGSEQDPRFDPRCVLGARTVSNSAGYCAVADGESHAVTLPGHVHRDDCDAGLLAHDLRLVETEPPLHRGYARVAALPANLIDVLNPSVNTKPNCVTDTDTEGRALGGPIPPCGRASKPSLSVSPEALRYGGVLTESLGSTALPIDTGVWTRLQYAGSKATPQPKRG